MRQQAIMNYLAKNKAAQISALVNHLNVTAVTIRHDLDELERAGKLQRSHGGAVLIETPALEIPILDAIYHPPHIPNLELKEELAALATRCIEPNDSIFLGGGNTFCVMAHYLKNFPQLKLVTTSVNAAYLLAPHIPSIYFIGGELVMAAGVCYTGGPKIPLELDKVFVNKAFITVSGIGSDLGMTINDLSQLNIYMSLPKMATEVVLVCDRTKFGYQGAHKIGALQSLVDTVVTNGPIDHIYCEPIRALGIRLITE
jgi:DeoR/GlpR family transcriptional regulator of sugar metabolism